MSCAGCDTSDFNDGKVPPRHLKGCGHIFCEPCLFKVMGNGACLVEDCDAGAVESKEAHTENPVAFSALEDCDISNTTTCGLHDDAELTKYCTDCGTWLCDACADDGSHESHDLVAADDFIDQIIEDVNAAGEVAKGFCDVLLQNDEDTDFGKRANAVGSSLIQGFGCLGINIVDGGDDDERTDNPFLFSAIVKELGNLSDVAKALCDQCPSFDEE